MASPNTLERGYIIECLARTNIVNLEINRKNQECRPSMTPLMLTLDAYEAAGRTEDDIRDFLDWATAQRIAAAAASAIPSTER